MPSIQFEEEFWQSQGMQDLQKMILDLVGQPSSGASREEAIGDTEALMAKGVREFEQSVLPQITGAQEGAGASGSAITALLAQQAGIGKAGEVAELQLRQIMGAEQIQSAERGQGLDALTKLFQMLQSGQMQKQKTILDAVTGMQTPSYGSPSPMTSLPKKPAFVNPGPIYGPRSSQPEFRR